MKDWKINSWRKFNVKHIPEYPDKKKLSESEKILKVAIDAGVKKYIILGSCFEFGDIGDAFQSIPNDAALRPTAAYHASKAAFSMTN